MTGTWFPDADASRAVLVGAGTFDDRALSDLPAVRNNLTRLRDALTHPEVGLFAGRPDGHCRVLGLGPGPVDVRDIGATMARARREATDLLLVYYTGHGVLDDAGTLHLALDGTAADNLEYSALSVNVLKQDLARARARTRVLILDCCFSGRAIAAMAPLASLVSGQLQQSGTYVFTSSAANEPSQAPPEGENSAFTAALLRAFAAPEPFSLDETYRHVREELRESGLHCPQRQGTGDAGALVLMRGPLPDPPPPALARGTRRWSRRHRALTVALACLAVTAAGAIAALAGGETSSPQADPGGTSSVTSEPTPSSSPPHSSSSSSQSSEDDDPAADTPPQSDELTVDLFDEARTPDGAIMIGVTGAAGIIEDDGGRTAFSGGEGQIGGGAGVTSPTESDGGSATGIASFYVDAFGATCDAAGVALGESTVVEGPDDAWIRILVLSVGDTSDDTDGTPVGFEVTRGTGETPDADRACT